MSAAQSLNCKTTREARCGFLEETQPEKMFIGSLFASAGEEFIEA
jgi:hypothetical protein